MSPLEAPKKKNAATPSKIAHRRRRRRLRDQLVAMVVSVAAFVFVVVVVVVVGAEAVDGDPATFLLEEDDGGDGDIRMQRIPTQFIAALGDPNASSGTGAKEWGIWTVDPGPRGVRLADFAQRLKSTTSSTSTTTTTTTESVVVGPYGWKFDANDWWLEEHGLVMEQPDFPLPPARYVVTGGRETTSILTIDERGHWNLKDGASLHDVTHLPCRSARYRNTSSSSSSKDARPCSPTKAQPSKFPVRPGASMPHVDGCEKQEYAVIFVIGKEVPVPAQQQQQQQQQPREPPSIATRYEDHDSL